MYSLFRQLSRLSINTRNVSTTSILNIKLSEQLYAEPLKKKKKLDPAIIKAREDRKRKKIERQIRRLEKNARQLKPLDELVVPFNLIDEYKKRQRPAINLSLEQTEYRSLLQKDWARFKLQEYMSNVAQIDRIMSAQKRALDHLSEESEELYNEAVMPDLSLVPYKSKGPVATPPIKDYDSPDGEYIDVSKQWIN